LNIVPVTDEIRERPSFQRLREAWAEFLFHDPFSNEYWTRLYSERSEFQFALVDGEEVLAEGNSIPVTGMPAGWRDAFPNGFGEGEPDRLCALAVLIGGDHQGKGLSKLMLEHMRSLGAKRGWELVAPVRPTLKERYPLTPIEHYAEWRRDDGHLFDPWLRAHERLGAEVVGTAPEAMRIAGTVGEWEEWAGMAFPDSGSYVVPRALVPVEIDCERDEGLYVEPCVWMRHRTP
jgi:GNAT superfamily N-acetyltransferase